MPQMQKKRVLLPTLGNDYSKPLVFADDRNVFGQNWKYREDLILQTPGSASYGTGTLSGGVPIHMAPLLSSGLTLYAYRFSSDKSEKYNSGTSAWDDVTKSGTDWTGVEGTDFFSSAVVADYLCVSNGIDDIQSIQGADANFADLGGSPPKAKYLESYGDYLVLGDVDDGGTRYPTRIQWCDTGDPTDWTTGNAGSFDLADSPEEIVGMRKLNEFLVVFKQDAIYVGRLVDTVDVFSFTLQVTGIGAMNNRVIVEQNGVIYFLGIDGMIYAFNGYRAEPVGEEIREQIHPSLNYDALKANFAQKNQRDSEIWFYVAESGNSWPNVKWKFNYRTGILIKDTANNATCSMMFRDTSGDLAWGDGSGDWAAQASRWGDVAGGTGFDFMLVSKQDGVTYKVADSDYNDGGSAIDMIVDTKDLTLGHLDRYKRWIGPLEYWAYGNGTVDLYYSTDKGLTWTAIQTDTLTATMTKYTVWFDILSVNLRLRWRNSNSGEFFVFQGYNLFAYPRELEYR